MLSFKSLIERVAGHGRKAILQISRNKKRYTTDIKLTESLFGENGRRLCNKSGQQSKSGQTTQLASSRATGRQLFQYLGPVTSRLFHGFVRKVPSPLWATGRKKTAQRLFGETAPYFALVGVTLVSGPDRGLLTEKDELEALCGDIREAISRAGWIHNPNFWNTSSDSMNEHNFSLSDFELGPVIDKGCNAVVYAAKWKSKDPLAAEKSQEEVIIPEEFNNESFDVSPTKMTQIEALDLHGLDLTTTLGNILPMNPSRHLSLCEDVDLLASNGFQRPSKQPEEVEEIPSTSRIVEEELPLAVKMLFNYEAESNALSILKAMQKELIPARNLQADLFSLKMNQLPRHANVVEMPCVFVDRVPLLEGGLDLYPQALPHRIHPGGFGRNMSLFCVMKRYDCSLSDYLHKFEPTLRTSCLLFAQLLEGIEHLSKYKIAHRDLKTDNLLVDLSEGLDSPHLVISDFGCCLATSSMKAPFPSSESDPRQGNLALMAPEVRGSEPGILSRVNFDRCDLWSCGAIAFEIFGLENPFSSGKLNSLGYQESQIPKLPKNVPSTMRHLVIGLLKRNPNHRPNARLAATVAQLSLWGPSKWLSRHALLLPSHSEVMRWLLCLSTKVLCEAGTGGATRGGHLEYEVVSSFLSRVHYCDILEAIEWMRSAP